MVFSSMYFIFVFLPLTCGSYFLAKKIFPSKIWLRNLILLVFSLFFYAWGEPLYVFLMLLSISINFLFGFLFEKNKCSKLLFIISIIFNLSFLIVFKYTGFYIQNINTLFNLSINVPQITLPIGISFYTFQALSYIIDVYRKKVDAQKNYLNLALYISLFPQLIAGPIVRYTDIQKEIEQRNDNFENFISGLKQFMFGLSAKVIIANNLAVFADNVYSNIIPQEFNVPVLVLWLAAICYSLQIYFDFSGYSLMAIGLGKMFGFNFPENFNHPYCAKSITDFWRRWHITLSSWFRDYVYIPLGGNRVKPVRHIFNILITWCLTGFWHGANWNFIIWGLYYAILLIIEKYIVKEHYVKFLNRFITLFLILIGWVIFRIEDFSQLCVVFKGMFGIYNVDSTVQIPGLIEYISEHSDVFSKVIFIIPAIIGSMPVYNKIFSKSKESNTVLIIEYLCIFILFLISICLLEASTYNPFIYFRF